jgi:hypothetical protein
MCSEFSEFTDSVSEIVLQGRDHLVGHGHTCTCFAEQFKRLVGCAVDTEAGSTTSARDEA